MQSQNKYKLNAFDYTCYPWHRSHESNFRGERINNNNNRKNGYHKQMEYDSKYLLCSRDLSRWLLWCDDVFHQFERQSLATIELVAIDFFFLKFVVLFSTSLNHLFFHSLVLFANSIYCSISSSKKFHFYSLGKQSTFLSVNSVISFYLVWSGASVASIHIDSEPLSAFVSNSFWLQILISHLFKFQLKFNDSSMEKQSTHFTEYIFIIE